MPYQVTPDVILSSCPAHCETFLIVQDRILKDEVRKGKQLSTTSKTLASINAPIPPLVVHKDKTLLFVFSFNGDGVLICSIDNMPTQIPMEATEYFGNLLLPYVPDFVSWPFGLWRFVERQECLKCCATRF